MSTVELMLMAVLLILAICFIINIATYNWILIPLNIIALAIVSGLYLIVEQ